MRSSLYVKDFKWQDGSASRPSARPAVAPYLMPLSLRAASVSCVIWLPFFSWCQSAPDSFVILIQDRSPWLASALCVVSLRFLSRRLRLFPRSLPSALRDSHPCTYPAPISTPCYR